MTLARDVRDGLRLPVDGLRVLARRWPEVLAWTIGGYVAHEFLVRVAAWVATGSLAVIVTGGKIESRSGIDVAGRVAGLGLLGLAALATLVSTVGVFYSLRREVPLGQDALGAQDGRASRLHDVLALTLAPFLGFYAAWGLLDADLAYYTWLGKNDAINLVDMSVAGFGLWLAITAVAAFAAKLGAGTAARRVESPVLQLVESVLEATYLYLTVFALARAVGWLAGWAQTRVAWQWDLATYREIVDLLPVHLDMLLPASLRAYAGMLGAVLGPVKEGVVQPLVWLAIAMIIFQHIGRGKPPAQPRADRPLPVRRAAARVATSGMREKYVTFAAAARATLRAGLIPFLFFCAWYLAVDVIVGWGWVLLARYGIGPHELSFWQLVHDWQRLGEGVLTDVLRLPLLAAGFALVVRRIRAGNAAAPDSVRAP